MIWIWSAFIVFVLAMLAVDLFIAHRKSHVVGLREALAWSGVWAGIALLFAVFIYHGYENHWMGLGVSPDAADGVVNDGRSATVKYLTGYVVEKTLSVDNIFVMAVVFSAFAIPSIYQHRVLFWGIFGALVMRGIMIGVGAELIARYHWVLYVFGAFLMITAVKMLLVKDEKPTTATGETWLIRLVRRWLPVTQRMHGEHFWWREQDRWHLTPLALSLVGIEGMDAVFAVDSIPAIFGVTADPFLVFTSNVFAMLGLRSLYFALAGMVERFAYLKVSLAVVLGIVGLKLLAHTPLERLLGDSFNFVTLGAVLLVLGIGIAASMARPRSVEARA